MTEIVSFPNCGNSPRIEFLKKYIIVFANLNIEYLAECVSNRIVWDIIGYL